MLKRIALLALLGLSETLALAQGEPTKEGFDLSGYLQLHYQLGQEDATLIGAKREPATSSYSRIGIRRGRAKLSYTKGLTTAVMQIDLTERGLGLKDAYIHHRLPLLGQSALQGGLFDRPFGYEVSYSSSKRESPERALITQTLFPNERDLGLMLTLQAPQSSAWSLLRLDAGLFSGHGIKAEQDSRLDFIGRLSAQYAPNKAFELSGGASMYYGGVHQSSPEVYQMVQGHYIHTSNPQAVGQYAKRQYIGLDIQLKLLSPLGKTKLHAEWMAGQQPGSPTSSKSPNGSLSKEATYIRPIQGGYALLVQEVSSSALALFAKYDWYDPNTSLSGKEIGQYASGAADLSYSTIGLGMIYHLTPSLKATAYAERVWNETSPTLPMYANDRQDNKLTLELQYKF